MMNLWKRNAVVSVVVLFVCVALYLSWSYGRDSEEALVFEPGSPAVTETKSESGEDTVNETETETEADIDIDYAENSSGYFAEARLTRQQARDKALDMLNDAVSREDVSQNIKDNATGEIEKLAQNAMMEATIENLIIAKGYSECVAFINSDGINIVVAAPVGGLNVEDTVKITDIVTTESTMTALDIKIVEVEV